MHAPDFGVNVAEREDLAMIAMQGPNARAQGRCRCWPRRSRGAALELTPFFGAAFGSWFVARTGYTGEDGFEIMMPAVEAATPGMR